MGSLVGTGGVWRVMSQAKLLGHEYRVALSAINVQNVGLDITLLISA